MVLWIAPELNHYKARMLNLLSMKLPGLHVLSANTSLSQGHREASLDVDYPVTRIDVRYKLFAFKIKTYKVLFTLLRKNRFRIVLMPMEKKFIPFIVFLYICKMWFHFRLATYTHHFRFQKNRKIDFAYYIKNKSYMFIQAMFDIIIYYTEQGYCQSIQRNLVNPTKAFFANNTLDIDYLSHFIAKENGFRKNILYIGRLIAEKRIDILIDYFKELKNEINNCELDIIGDGPEADYLKKLAGNDPSIKFHGAIVDESKIAVFMNRSRMVFVPFHAGLVIVHAFAYRKPFVTFHSDSHPPEASYLVDNVNAIILRENRNENITAIKRLLTDDTFYAELSTGAYRYLKDLTPRNWVDNVLIAFGVTIKSEM